MNNKQKLVYIYFIILPFIDLITSLFTRFTDLKISLGMIVKAVTIIISLLYIFIYSKSKYRKVSITYLVIVFIAMIIGIITKINILKTFKISAIANEITYIVKYGYFLIMTPGILNIFDDFNIDNNFVKKIIYINCIIYTCLLLIPFFTGTSFNSYRYASVLGKNGWFYAANETGVIVLILLTSFKELMNNQNKKKILLLIPILLSITLIGTKVSFFGMILISILTIIYFIIKEPKEKFKLPIIAIAFLIPISLISPTIINLQNSIERAEQSNNEIGKYKSLDELIKNKTTVKIIKIALNGRENFFLNNYGSYTEGNVADKLFGIGWTDRDDIDYTFKKKLIEIDYLDILIHYGIIGCFIYTLPLLYLLYKLIKNKKKINLEIIYYTLILFLIIGVSFFAGHTFSAPSVSIYISLIFFIILNKINEEKEINSGEISIMALHLNYGGVEKYISSLCKILENDYKINLIVTYKINDKPAFEFSDKIHITYLINNGPNKEELKEAIKNKNILKVIKEGIKSIIILTKKRNRNINAIKKINSEYIITTRTFHNKLVSKYASDKIIKIATEHNYHNNDKKYINELVKSLNKFDYLVTVSETLREFYSQKLTKTKCVYIPNIIDELPKNKSNLNENLLINVGRLEKEKGQDDLIDIIKEVSKKIKDVKLYIIGDGSLKETLLEKIKTNNLENNIILTGFLSKKEIEKYYLKSKLFVLTSHTESFGIVLIEAMSYGIPCIAFDSADGAKNLLSNDNGILIKKRNKKEMSEQIIKMLKNKNTINKYSINGYNKCMEFLPDKVYDKWKKILQK